MEYFELFPHMEIVLNSNSLQGISRLWREKVLMDEHNYPPHPVILIRKQCYGKYLCFTKHCRREAAKNNSELCGRIFIRQNKGRITAARNFGHDCTNFNSYVNIKKCRWRLSNKQDVSVATAVSLTYVQDISNHPAASKISETNSVFFESLVSFYTAGSYHEWQTNPKILNRTGNVWSTGVQQIRRQHYAVHIIGTMFLPCNQFFGTEWLNPSHYCCFLFVVLLFFFSLLCHP